MWFGLLVTYVLDPGGLWERGEGQRKHIGASGCAQTVSGGRVLVGSLKQ